MTVVYCQFSSCYFLEGPRGTYLGSAGRIPAGACDSIVGVPRPPGTGDCPSEADVDRLGNGGTNGDGTTGLWAGDWPAAAAVFFLNDNFDKSSF